MSKSLAGRVAALERLGNMGERVLLCIWGDKTEAQISDAIRERARAIGIAESRVDVVAVPWLTGRALP